jgi:hypothetical protein
MANESEQTLKDPYEIIEDQEALDLGEIDPEQIIARTSGSTKKDVHGIVRIGREGEWELS